MSNPLATLELNTLVERALKDGDGRSDHLVELHRRATRQVFDRAVQLCRNPSADERILGVRVLRELGGPPPIFAEDAVPLLLPMLERETDDEVVRWLISALGYQHMSGHKRSRLMPSPGVLTAVLSRRSAGSSSVRFAIAAALPKLVDLKEPQQEAIDSLLGLASDIDADVRWYALAALIDDLDLARRPAVATAITMRLEDDDAQIRTSAQRVLSGGSWGS